MVPKVAASITSTMVIALAYGFSMSLTSLEAVSSSALIGERSSLGTLPARHSARGPLLHCRMRVVLAHAATKERPSRGRHSEQEVYRG